MSYLYYFLDDFYIQLLAANLLFCPYFKRRKYFWIRAAISLAVYIGASFGFAQLFFYLNNFEAYFPIIFLMIAVMTYTCFDMSAKDVLFCVCAAYSVQFIAGNVRTVLTITFGLETHVVWEWVVYILSYTATYTGAYFLFSKRFFKKDEEINLGNLRTLLLTATVVAFAYIFSILAIETGISNNIIYRVYASGTCVLALFIQFGLFSQNRLERENDIIQHLLAENKHQLNILKENIEAINMKCHDLKYQVSALRAAGTSKEQEQLVNELEQSVLIYDSIAKTENHTLDLVLTEKKLICEKNKIKFAYIADGKKLNFMKSADIYTLFGNALDNAIESVNKSIDEDKKIINMNISSKGNLVYVSIENYAPEKVEFKNGLPVTSKKDKQNHGYGVKSINYIANKYGGKIALSYEDEIFTLSVILPFPA